MHVHINAHIYQLISHFLFLKKTFYRLNTWEHISSLLDTSNRIALLNKFLPKPFTMGTMFDNWSWGAECRGSEVSVSFDPG